MNFSVAVEVSLRAGVADPEGATIERALPALGYEAVDGVSVGKLIRLSVSAADADAAQAMVESMCERFLTNPVIEDASIRIEPSAGS